MYGSLYTTPVHTSAHRGPTPRPQTPMMYACKFWDERLNVRLQIRRKFGHEVMPENSPGGLMLPGVKDIGLF
ncbi:hypothetical protein J6590_079919 [Homalodisca vitripennis]|nr:hypothetical protein J6590_079919 [Homalodisca vitripennis]